ITVDGTYYVKNAPIGKVLVAVETESAKPFDPTYQRTGGGPPAGVSVPNMKYVRIPPRYGKANESGLSLEVTGGAQQHDLVLR
ncbi:MAG: hypothetical protein SNJ82_09705, partial [Gemmataceae bacterium]